MTDILRSSVDNPFALTKATELTDDQIVATFVPNDHVLSRLSPASAKPILLTGGKGSGRTHLLRYWSSAAQIRRSEDSSLPDVLASEGHLGVYCLLGGLNASRFDALEVDDGARLLLFGYSLDLMLLARLLGVVEDLAAHDSGISEATGPFAEDAARVVWNWLQRDENVEINTMEALTSALAAARRALDREISRAIVEGRRPNPTTVGTPGEVVFDVASALVQNIPALRDLRISFLLDELENISEVLQRYVQTIIRERRDPVALVVGSRSYGVRTLETMAAGEVNRIGHELDEVPLDDLLRSEEAHFEEFCSRVISKRMHQALLDAPPPETLLPEVPTGQLVADASQAARRQPQERLNRALTASSKSLELDEKEIANIVDSVASEDPLATRAAVLHVYLAWSAGKDLQTEAEVIRLELRRYEKTADGRIKDLLGHRRSDLVAQMRRDAQLPQDYFGMSKLTRLADGNPRNFMNIMRFVFSWWTFKADRRFGEAPVPPDIQALAVTDATEWHWHDSQVVGPNANRVREGIERLGDLLSQLRFAPKPPESSICAVTIDLAAASAVSRETIETAIEWALLVEREPRRHRNEIRRVTTVQINRMLAPRWDLPLGRRGVLNLAAEEVDSIFEYSDRSRFEGLLAQRVERARPPFRARKSDRAESPSNGQLFDP
jgi:hypothetical protein